MTIPARLTAHLDQSHAAYIPIHHAPARSSQYAASLLHIPGKGVAKTVALRAGKQILLAVLPASYHVNLEKLAALVGQPVKLIDEQECYRLFPDCQPGAIPPFGELYGVPVYLDTVLAQAPEIIFGAGTLSDAIRMGNTDFVYVVKPRICSFADEGEIASQDRIFAERKKAVGNNPCQRSVLPSEVAAGTQRGRGAREFRRTGP